MASTDTVRDNTNFAKKNGATFPILSDTFKRMSTDFGVLSDSGYARRWTFYIDAEGIIQKIDKAVNPSTAGKDLVNNLRELGFPKSKVASD